jgi:hypothetical protein
MQTQRIKKYKIIILTVVLYEREIWSLTLKMEHRLNVSETNDMGRTAGLTRGEVTKDEDIRRMSCIPCTLR